MRGSAATAVALMAAAFAAGCAQISIPGSPSTRERITLLPSPDGTVGTVVVNAGGSQVTLDTAFATAEVRGETITKIIAKTDAEAAASRDRIEVAVAALPDRPRKYLVFYLLDQLVLTPDSSRNLDAIKHHIAGFPAPEVIVTGHADRLGSPVYNDALSLRRAQQIRDVLLGAGVPGETIEVVGRGEREPLVATPDNFSEPRNRRVEIKVR